jgi:hypothetical protein
MGFVLTVLYFVTYYFTPVKVFGPLAALRIELVLALLVLVVSIPALTKSFILKTPQSLAILGLALSVFLSVLIGMHWPGGAANAIQEFIPNAYGYFLVCLHCDSKRKLQILVLMLMSVCLFVVAQGSIDLHYGEPQRAAPHSGEDERASLSQWNAEHQYLLPMNTDNGGRIYRLRGPGQINDPNDFGQLIVCVIPLTFIFWRPNKLLLNIVCVILPVSVLVLGVYLTHSRGALLALLAVAVVATRRRIGTLPTLLLAGGLFAAASALHFTGGREISANAGADRTGLWGAGLQMLKSHPLFGVGYGNFSDFAGLTAHNSIVVCAGELGLFGLYFWSLFLFPTARNALAVASPGKVSEAEPIPPAEGPFSSSTRTNENLDKREVNRLGRLAVLSLTGFLAAAMFLSRAYVMTLFLLGGIAEVVFEMGQSRGMIAPRLPAKRLLMYAGVLAISMVVLMYIMIRILNVMR